METKEYYGGTYPEPFDLDFDIERNKSKDEIIEYIKDNLDDFTWYDEEIHEVVIESEVLPNEE